MALKKREFTPESGTVDTYACKRFVSAAHFICSYRLELVQSLRSSTHVRIRIPLPLLRFSLPAMVVSRVS